MASTVATQLKPLQLLIILKIYLPFLFPKALTVHYRSNQEDYDHYNMQ